MRKIIYLLICLCFAWIIHFQQTISNVYIAPLKVDKVCEPIYNDYYSRRAYIKFEKDGRIIIIPWFNILYIEEVD